MPASEQGGQMNTLTGIILPFHIQSTDPVCEQPEQDVTSALSLTVQSMLWPAEKKFET